MKGKKDRFRTMRAEHWTRFGHKATFPGSGTSFAGEPSLSREERSLSQEQHCCSLIAGANNGGQLKNPPLSTPSLCESEPSWFPILVHLLASSFFQWLCRCKHVTHLCMCNQCRSANPAPMHHSEGECMSLSIQPLQ